VPRGLRRRLNAPEYVWSTMTASAATYDAADVLHGLNAVAWSRGAHPQAAAFPTRPDPRPDSAWWLGVAVWSSAQLTLCAWSDADGTDLLIAAWGDEAEAAIVEIDRLVSASE
jgi:hypothetical protein